MCRKIEGKDNMSDFNIFSLNICPRCGKISVLSKEKCPYCSMDMHKLERQIDSEFIFDIGKNLNVIYNQYYKKEYYNKKLWQQREKIDLKEIKLHGKLVWEKNLKTNIKVCPKCGDIITNNYLINFACCARCNEKYEEISVSGFDYYYPSLKGEGHVLDKIEQEMNRLGVNFEVNLSMDEETNITSRGLVLELIALPNRISNANKNLNEIFSEYIPLVSKYCFAIDKNRDEKDVIELSYIINHIQNTLRGQRFIGQEKAVNFLTLMFIEVEKQYFK